MNCELGLFSSVLILTGPPANSTCITQGFLFLNFILLNLLGDIDE